MHSNLRRLCFATGLLLGSVITARADDASQILKAMSDFVAGQKNILVTFDSDIEVLTSDLQKLQFTSSGRVALSRPDKLRATRTGGYADVELVFDGKTLTVHDRDNKVYAQSEAAGSVADLVERLRNEFFVEAPGADLLLSGAYEKLTENVFDAKHIGLGVIDGVECEHLAFRSVDTDWQIWIEVGSRPIPRKYVITNKAVTGGPQYTLRIRDWQTDAQSGPDTFAFKAPPGATKIEFRGLAQIDEVPAGVIIGEKK